MFFIDLIFSIVGVLLRIAFFTLVERKFIGLAHFRKGPNKVLLRGLSQPIRDAVKLLTKERIKLNEGKPFFLTIGPTLSIRLMLICWCWYLFNFSRIRGNIKVIIIFATIRLVVYGLLLMRWGSNRKYATLGGHRGVAQVISYEVCLLLFILTWVFIRKSYDIVEIALLQQNIWGALISLPFFTVWITLCIAETNRTPFDMAEGESEIVSGFNIEYGGGLFALIFIAEYGSILFLRFLTTVFFLGGTLILIKTIIVGFIFIWARCSFPRVRYDTLILISWKTALPYRLFILILTSSLF